MLNISQWFATTNAPPPTDPVAMKAAAQAAAAKNTQRRERLAKLRTEEPTDVRIARQILERRGKKSVYRAVYCAQFTLSAEQLLSGQLPPQIEIECAPQSTTLDREKWLLARGERAYLLSAEVVESDSSSMPFSTTWTLANEVDGGRVYVCPPRRKWSAAKPRDAHKQHDGRQKPSIPLLSQPVSIEEPSLDLQVSSIQAVGFNASALMSGAARKTRTDHYKVSKAYPYAGLIRDVHAALTLAEQRARWEPLDVETAPLSSYELQSSPTHMLISAQELDRVTKYITERLLTANEPFEVERLKVRIEPFGGDTWLDAWQSVLEAADNARAIATTSAPPTVSQSVSVGIAIVVYFCTLPDRELAAQHHQANNGSTNSNGEVRMHTMQSWDVSRSDDEDGEDDDDMTLVDTIDMTAIHTAASNAKKTVVTTTAATNSTSVATTTTAQPPQQ